MTLRTRIKGVASRLQWPRPRGRAWLKATLYCSFCSKSQDEVAKLIAGPSVFICDECVKICTDIIAEPPSARSPAVESKDVAAVESQKDTPPAEPHKIEDVQSMPTERLLHWLRIQEALSEHARAGVQEAIDTLRKREVSWATIGEALGISRQAAWERFS